MINMTVIKGKDLLKYLVELTIIISIVVGLTRYFSSQKSQKQEINWLEKISVIVENVKKTARIYSIHQAIPMMNGEKKEGISQVDQDSIEQLLNTELSMTQTLKEKEETKVEIAEKPQEENKETQSVEEAQINVQTEVIDQSGINTKFTNEYNSVKIKNESKYDLTPEILTPDIELENKKDILIFHTHTCESYTATEAFPYQPTGNFRTNDLNFSVARVGAELKKHLDAYGYQTVHDQTYHDYPAYTGSYNRSLVTVKNQLALKPETQMVFDIHRDAVGSKEDYAPTVKIGEEYAAQLMFVIGTDGGGLSHPNWQQNLKFAIKIQEKANELYPGLFKPIIVRNSRYNQHVTKAASIIEVGATGNTMEQCLTSMKYLSKVISEVVK